jgi:hypothetical protein
MMEKFEGFSPATLTKRVDTLANAILVFYSGFAEALNQGIMFV